MKKSLCRMRDCTWFSGFAGNKNRCFFNQWSAAKVRFRANSCILPRRYQDLQFFSDSYREINELKALW